MAGMIYRGVNKRSLELFDKQIRLSQIQKNKANEMKIHLDRIGEDFNTGDLLVSSSREMANTLDEMTSKIERLKSDMNVFNRGMKKVGRSSLSLNQSSSNLSHETDFQAAIIEESSTAVNQMSNSIKNL